STQLVFHRYGNRYFLYQIWVRGENRGRELPQTRLERELASNRQPAPVAVLASKLGVNGRSFATPDSQHTLTQNVPNIRDSSEPARSLAFGWSCFDRGYFPR